MKNPKKRNPLKITKEKFKNRKKPHTEQRKPIPTYNKKKLKYI